MTSSPPLVDLSAVIAPSARIHPSARVDAGAVIEDDVLVGPHCVVGARTRLRARSILVEHTTLGEDNDVHPYAVLGGDPQDKSFDRARRGELIIGDRNTFREGVTINRGNWNGPATRIGSGCYLMCQAHVGHNAMLGDNAVLANCACLAGHSRLGSGSVMSAFCAIHQFTEVGEGVMFRAHAAVSMHVPPYVVVGGANFVAGLNKVGLRRNPALTPIDRDEVKQVFRAMYRRDAAPIEEVLRELEADAWGPAASHMILFVRNALSQTAPRNRGVCGSRKTATRGGATLRHSDTE